MNDPWGDLVNYFRDLTNTGVRFQMIMSTLDGKPVVSRSMRELDPSPLRLAILLAMLLSGCRDRLRAVQSGYRAATDIAAAQ